MTIESATEKSNFTPGQRWISEAEPELGLGTVLKTEDLRVTILFPASGETRMYSIDNPPLKRVQFRPGDQIRTHDDSTLKVESVEASNGLLVYHGGGYQVPETDLSDSISFDKPQERLLAGHADPCAVFDLRYRTLLRQQRIRQSELRGFVGARIDLIPHQLYIAHEVTSRQAPRVLLADEVGLGKTIEACLILHRLLATRRVARVLILVPEPLINQWFVELLRKFNLQFSIFDEERCESIEANDPEANPFLEDQLVLTHIELLLKDEKRAAQVTAGEWDLLIVDEAHHLGWSPEEASPEYRLAEALSRNTPGLLLLTATPEQLGQESHFARLRLLDPDRYYDLEVFRKENTHFQQVAKVAEKLTGDKKLTATDRKALAKIFSEAPEQVRQRLDAVDGKQSEARARLLEDLLDQHGTGRVMLRNTRAAMTGFPKRKPHLTKLSAGKQSGLLDQLSREYAADTGSIEQPNYDFQNDPRIEWLVKLVRKLKEEKILLICRTKEKVAAIESALREKINLKIAVFHEELELIQRDRNAAWFAEEDGAQILVCSEIGSEGRNFQFAHHLVLFDLPHDPELLEQRIGRLDRIGQTSDIHIHVPYVTGSSQEVLVRWYHEGLRAFEANLECGNPLLEKFGKAVDDLAIDFHETESSERRKLEKLIQDSRALRDKLETQLRKGRDRLLEMNSFKPEVAEQLVNAITDHDRDDSLDEFLQEMFDHFGIHLEELGHRRYLLGAGDLVKEAFPALPPEGMVVTCDRAAALSREDVGFLSWDHPVILGAIDMLVSSEQGNCAFGILEDNESKGIFLEAVYLLECVAPAPLHADRFLPATPIRVVIDYSAQDQTEDWPGESFSEKLKDGPIHQLLSKPEIGQILIPRMLKASRKAAEQRTPEILEKASAAMTGQLRHEVERLRNLSKVNKNVRRQEIELAEMQLEELDHHLANSRLRLDSVRLIWRGRLDGLQAQ